MATKHLDSVTVNRRSGFSGQIRGHRSNQDHTAWSPTVNKAKNTRIKNSSRAVLSTNHVGGLAGNNTNLTSSTRPFSKFKALSPLLTVKELAEDLNV